MTTREKTKGMVIKPTPPEPKKAPRHAPGEALTFGGVHAKRGEPALHELTPAPQPVGKASSAGIFPDFQYHGGPVVTCPLVYTSFWGPMWTSDQAHATSADRLNQYHQDLLKSDFMNVLSQYGAGFGAGSGAFIQPSFVSNVANTISDADIHTIIQSCIDAGALPEPTNPSNIVLMIYLDETIGVENPPDLILCEPNGDTAFGYHNFFTTTAGNPFYYAVIPALTDDCLKESCPNDDAGCSLHLSEQQEQRRTQVASHEFAEMTTDPQLNAWYDPANGENGDICNGEPDTITVGANAWTVQRIYSKYDDLASNGATYCLSQAPSPEPRLSPGPVARPAIMARARQVPSHERLLPLPALQFNATTKEVSMEEQHVRKYVRGAFYPLFPEHIMADFSGFLHGIANALEK